MGESLKNLTSSTLSVPAVSTNSKQNANAVLFPEQNSKVSRQHISCVIRIPTGSLKDTKITQVANIQPPSIKNYKTTSISQVLPVFKESVYKSTLATEAVESGVCKQRKNNLYVYVGAPFSFVDKYSTGNILSYPSVATIAKYKSGGILHPTVSGIVKDHSSAVIRRPEPYQALWNYKLIQVATIIEAPPPPEKIEVSKNIAHANLERGPGNVTWKTAAISMVEDLPSLNDYKISSYPHIAESTDSLKQRKSVAVAPVIFEGDQRVRKNDLVAHIALLPPLENSKVTAVSSIVLPGKGKIYKNTLAVKIKDDRFEVRKNTLFAEIKSPVLFNYKITGVSEIQSPGELTEHKISFVSDVEHIQDYFQIKKGICVAIVENNNPEIATRKCSAVAQIPLENDLRNYKNLSVVHLFIRNLTGNTVFKTSPSVHFEAEDHRLFKTSMGIEIYTEPTEFLSVHNQYAFAIISPPVYTDTTNLKKYKGYTG